jgi:2-desacetyl-2-hydroxyethyl bacteriochlorophyllide A dehydrogenase
MKALVWTNPNEMLIQEVEKPSAQNGEVVIKVDAVGICGSEIEGFLGHNSLRVPPLVMGHEFSGVVVESNDSEDLVGKRVVVNPLINCGKCNRCRQGLENLCDNRQILGIHRPGAFGEYVAVPSSAVVPIPEQLNSYAASLTEPLACSLRATRRAMSEKPFANVLVYGAGTIGLLSAFIAKILGAENVIVMDLNEERLKTVQEAGVEHVIQSNKENVAERVTEITGEKGVDVIIDAAGFIPTRQEAVQIVNPGGVIMNIGLGIDETPIPINQTIRSEITQLGSFCYTKQDFYDALQLLISGKINESIWSEVRTIEEGHQSFEDLVNGKVIKSKIFLHF